MFKEKINDFFIIENKFFKNYKKKNIKEEISIEEYRSEMM